MNIILLAAGRGSRMGNSVIHKGLLPVNGKAVISYLFEKFPTASYTIAVSHNQDQLKQFIAHAHPDAAVQFVDVGSLDTPGAGPGLSLMKCLEIVAAPALVTLSDSIIDFPEIDENALGYAAVPIGEQRAYCNLLVKNGFVADVKDKTFAGSGYFAWTGTMFIKDWEKALSNLKSAVSADTETQCSTAWGDIQFIAVPHKWTDIGTKDRYESVIAQTGFDYSKPEEITYVYEPSKVIKFFANPDRLTTRCVRRNELLDYTENEILRTPNFVSYPFIKGDSFYSAGTPKMFAAFLNDMQSRYWANTHEMSPARKKSIWSFYRSKNLERAAQFGDDIGVVSVNGQTIDVLWPELLARLNDSAFSDPRLVNFHGDLQFDNMIVTPDKNIKLIDWRDRFDELQFGDVYYELGKIFSGTLFDFDLIRKNLFSVNIEGDDMTISMPRRTTSVIYQDQLSKFCNKHGYDWDTVRLAGFLNIMSMAPLHKNPYSQCLYFFSLSEVLKDTVLINRFFSK